MRKDASILLLSSATLFMVSCGGNSGITSAGASNPGYGPFDRNGNYVEAWADKPAKKHWWARKPADTPVATEKPTIASTTAKPKPVASKPATRPTEVASLDRTYTRPKPTPTPVAYNPPPTPRPKPKPTPAPVKPKAPASIRHKVVKGDTLYNISRRHGTSVSAIQRANGIKGTTIRLGQTLKVPK
jgi:LysM repeat protein